MRRLSGFDGVHLFLGAALGTRRQEIPDRPRRARTSASRYDRIDDRNEIVNNGPRTSAGWQLGAIAITAAAFAAGACGGEPPATTASFEMVTGSYRTVAEGRAEITIGELHDEWREDLGRNVEWVDVEVSCAEQTRVVEAVADAPSDEVCRVRIQLQKIVTWSPPKARIQVIWDEP
jgi:hypothetical protein